MPKLGDEKALQAWRGQLQGKVILYGRNNTDLNLNETPASKHFNPDDLHSLVTFPLRGDESDESLVSPRLLRALREGVEVSLFQISVGEFFSEEGAVAVLVPGGSSGVLHDDINSSFRVCLRAQHRQLIPEAVVATENYDCMLRLLKHRVPVSVGIDTATEFGDEHAKGYNTVAEIAGIDPNLKNEVVMVGGHPKVSHIRRTRVRRRHSMFIPSFMTSTCVYAPNTSRHRE